MLQHEVHHLRGDLLGGTYQVALVLAVLIIDDDDKLAIAEIIDGLGYGVQFEFAHFLSLKVDICSMILLLAELMSRRSL